MGKISDHSIYKLIALDEIQNMMWVIAQDHPRLEMCKKLKLIKFITRNCSFRLPSTLEKWRQSLIWSLVKFDNDSKFQQIKNMQVDSIFALTPYSRKFQKWVTAIKFFDKWYPSQPTTTTLWPKNGWIGETKITH